MIDTVAAFTLSIFFCSIAFSMDENKPLRDSNLTNQLIGAVIWANEVSKNNSANNNKYDFNRIIALLESGADINGSGSKGLLTPLCAACFDGNLPLVKLLIDRGADVNQSAQYIDIVWFSFEATWQSPLAVALIREHENVAKLLRIAGAKLAPHDPPEAEVKLNEMLERQSEKCLIM